MTDPWPIFDASLEIRARGGGRSLRGRFPYSSGPGRMMATVSDRGRVRKERIAGDAFGWQMREFAKVQKALGEAIEDKIDEARIEVLRQELDRRNVHILAGHSFDRPLGNMKRGARVESSSEALEFEVDLPAEDEMPSYMRDTVAMIRAGLAGGVSPGFRVPPASKVKGAETFEAEPGNPGVQVRVINSAVLHELSIVTRPVYSETEIDARPSRTRAGNVAGCRHGCDTHGGGTRWAGERRRG